MGVEQTVLTADRACTGQEGPSGRDEVGLCQGGRAALGRDRKGG